MPLLPTRLRSSHFPVVSYNPETSGARPYSGDGNELSNRLLLVCYQFLCPMFQLIKHEHRAWMYIESLRMDGGNVSTLPDSFLLQLYSHTPETVPGPQDRRVFAAK